MHFFLQEVGIVGMVSEWRRRAERLYVFGISWLYDLT